MIISFFQNMTMIVSLMYLYTRFDDFILRKFTTNTYRLWIISMVSLLSILAMLNPFKLDGMIFDLRAVPILLASYVFGWKLGIGFIILPALYRGYLGGPTMWQGILMGLILPLVIGSLFRLKASNNVNSVIDLQRFLKVFIVDSISRLILMKLIIPMNYGTWLLVNINSFTFSLISLLCMVWMINDTSKSISTKNKLEHMSRHDSLTTLLNLQHFKEEVELLAKEKLSLAIAMIDIDYFKEYNDKHGHPAGDKILKEFALLLKENIREGDLLARYGGEEFIICFTKISEPEKAKLSIERIQKVLLEHSFTGAKTQPGGKLTASMGISFSEGEKSLDFLIQEADQALYEAKNKGRNQICFSSEKS